MSFSYLDILETSRGTNFRKGSETLIYKDLQKLEVSKEHLVKVDLNLQYNELIGTYYDKFLTEQVSNVMINRLDSKLERLRMCNRFWQIERYDKQRVKDFIKTNLCRDKFCNNCKKVKQAERMAKFMPEIWKYKEFNMSQLVLTVPNCVGGDLRETIKVMFKSFAKLIEYLKGKEKIKGLDFSWLAYKGAIRSLEVTYNKKDYHPHLHVLLIHGGQNTVKEHVNCYSHNKFQPGVIRKFSDFEILIQKIWCLLNNKEKVTLKAIEALDIGYSCMMDEFQQDDFLELFKYMTKADGLSDGKIMSYQNFKDLYEGLNSVRQIQGYGCLFRLKDEDLSELVDEQYDLIIEALKKEEEPVTASETVQALLRDHEYLLISRKKIYQHLKRV